PDFVGRIDEVLARCSEAGVEGVITIGTSLDDARSAIALTRRYPGRIHAAVGFHPHEADRVSDDHLVAMAALWREADVVAFGEMGLDYHYDLADRANQRRVFARQLELAAEVMCSREDPLTLPSPPEEERGSRTHDKPIIIHCREAFDDCESILVDHGFVGRRVVFHCFTGSAQEAAVIAERGWRISFTGIVTFPKSTELHAIAGAYPADRLMVETDSPYLSPVPVRGKKPNEPAHVAHIVKFLAELRGASYEELVARTHRNTCEFFNLK
ncbi:MAG: TatD family hydrolase, partial [Phycisphaerales bacterium]|nr:TatD family hydrolase [Phycisphaerales bacterium]